MARKFLLSILLFFVVVVYAQTDHINHIIIIDKTGSMIGQAGGTDIWDEVKVAIKSYVNSVNSGDKITIYTYAEMLSQPVSFIIQHESDKSSVNYLIDTIYPNGRNTCTYKALTTVMNTYNLNNENQQNLIYLYTDGINNCTGYSMQDVAEIFKARRDDYDYLYYISLGTKVPEDVEAAAANDLNIKYQDVPDPGEDPTIQLVSDSLIFDFSGGENEVTKSVVFKTTGINTNTKLSCELLGDNLDGIILDSQVITIDNNLGRICLKRGDGVIFNKDIDAKIKLQVASGNAKLSPDSFKVMLIFPKKGKSTIKFH